MTWPKRILEIEAVTPLISILAVSTLLHLATGLGAVWMHPAWEAPVLCIVYGLLRLPLLPSRAPAKPERSLRSVRIATASLVILYVLHDAFFLVFGDTFRLVMASEVAELVDVLPWRYVVAFSALIAIFLGIYLAHIDWKQPRKLTLALAGWLALTAIPILAPSLVPWGFRVTKRHIYPYAGARNVRAHGRLAMLLYGESERRRLMATLATTSSDRTAYEEEGRALAHSLRQQGSGRNVHLIVLESFVDPTLFTQAAFSRDPRHPSYVELLTDAQNFSKSPVFGGQTAQAEFEVLCGVPALHQVTSIEFNAFSGSSVNCLPRLLADAGYYSVASNAYKPTYFNTIKAYEGMGFASLNFPSQYASSRTTYLTQPIARQEAFLFDGDLFRQNIDHVKSLIRAAPQRPLFNYVLGVYGHFPFTLDPSVRPLVIAETLHGDEKLTRIANQFYYRTEAIAAYVRDLTALDPQSLIIIVSDHLPALAAGTAAYEMFGYLGNVPGGLHMNRLLIIENAKPRSGVEIHHYDLPSLILNYLTAGSYCASSPCNFNQRKGRDPEALRRAYLQIMTFAIR